MALITRSKIMVILIAACICLSGCSLFKPPQSKPLPQGAEPEISVYLHDSQKTKTMKFEDYIAGVVAAEMNPNWSLTALAAQAIVARTFTLEAIETKGGVPARGTQASTDIKEFQAYNAAAINDNVRQAVAMTRGLVATYQERPIKAWFHASAGGKTATAKEGLAYEQAEPPYIKSVASPDTLAPTDVKNWQATFTKNQVITALQTMGTDIKQLTSLTSAAKGPSGRTTSFKINDSIDVAAQPLRIALDSTKLKSLLITKIQVSGDQVIFSGSGYGHGVGMSQWGAQQMAAEGKTAQQIIEHYFPGVEIVPKWQ